MVYSITATFQEEEVKLTGNTLIDMFVVNASQSGWDPLYYANWNQDIVGYSLNATGDVLPATTTYTGLPINRESLSSNIEGEISGLSISIPNVDRVVESVIQDQDYLRGRDIYILTMFSKHLPVGTDAKFIGTDPDYRSHIKEKYFVDSTYSDEDQVSFSVKSKFELRKIILPNRFYSLECQWNLRGDYLSSTCDYSGGINSASYPTCDGTLENCRERNNESRFGGFPTIPRRGIIIV